MRKGFWLSVDALLALCLLAFIFLSFGFGERARPETVMVAQKESDLLAEWTKSHDARESEMLAQAKSLFPGNFVEIEWQGSVVSCCAGNRRKGGVVSVVGLIATKSGIERVSLSVFQ